MWKETSRLLTQLLATQEVADGQRPVFVSHHGVRLTRFGIYKIVRCHTRALSQVSAGPPRRRISPHVFRHTTAVHLLEAGVEPNVIRGWLGHVSLDTTSRYAEINIRMKQQALATCQPPSSASSEVLAPRAWAPTNGGATRLPSAWRGFLDGLAQAGQVSACTQGQARTCTVAPGSVRTVGTECRANRVVLTPRLL